MSDDIAQLYKQFYPGLVRFVTSLCDDSSIADDIAQNAFIQALKHIDSFDRRSSFKTWLFAIARNETSRYFRKYRKVLNIDDVQLAGELGISHAQSLDEQTANKILAQTIRTRIGALDEPQQTIARLRLIDDLPFKEIAARVGRTETHCRVSFFRTKRILREECPQ